MKKLFSKIIREQEEVIQKASVISYIYYKLKNIKFFFQMLLYI